MKMASLVSVVCLALLTACVEPVAAAVFSWEVSGPIEVMQGQSITLTLDVTASGALNIAHPDPAFTVDTAYTIGGGSDTPAALGMPPFSRTPQYNPQGKRLPDAVAGDGNVELTLYAPASLTPGDYDVIITPGTTTGTDLSPLSFTYTVTVTPAALKPIITILSPVSGSKWLYDSEIPVSVEVDDQGSPLLANPIADLDGEVSVSLGLDETGNWAGFATGLMPGPHTFSVSATNAAGTTVVESFFDVYVSFGQWLPPISLNKVRKSGSTLPVKFTILGALGPVDVIVPHVWLNGIDQGEASLLYDENGLPYYLLEIKVPEAGSHLVTVDDPCLSPCSVSKTINSR